MHWLSKTTPCNGTTSCGDAVSSALAAAAELEEDDAEAAEDDAEAADMIA